VALALGVKVAVEPLTCESILVCIKWKDGKVV
jgi:hypothetical protein